MKILILVCLSFVFNFIYSQTIIGGIINTYLVPTSYNSCTNIATVPNTSGISPGDFILIIQMKGVDINQTNSASFGDIQSYGSAGLHEIAQIQSITSNTITFVNTLVNQYDFANSVQFVVCPNYSSVVVASTLTTPSWDGSIGGVVFLHANSVSLSASIDASGTGFRGGLPSNDYYSPSNCGTATYSTTILLGAYKGEGVFSNSSSTYGRGKNANGGGGGNNLNAGGGGGGNAGGGGKGGNQWTGCGVAVNGGVGGTGLNNLNRLFLGGGGGGGHQNNSESTTGGRGGGIVVVKSNSVITNGNYIRSNGQSVSIVTGIDAAGGGGAGGSIFIQSPVIGNLNLEANGGNGGSVNNGFTGGGTGGQCHGTGGGGGGGFMAVSASNSPSILTSFTGGSGGQNINQQSNCFNQNHGSVAGLPGVILFNQLIPESTLPSMTEFTVSSNVIDNLCEPTNTNGEISIGVSPAGSYTYSWLHDPSLVGPVATGLVSGSYTVVVSVGTCSVDTTILINTISGIDSVASLIGNEFCNDLGSIDITEIYGGVAPYLTSTDGIVYSANNLSFDDLSAGTYTIYIKDANDCVFDFISTIIQESFGSPISNSVLRDCENGFSELILSAGGTGNEEFSINGDVIPQNGNVADSLLPGSYLISVSDANQCTSDTIITIPPFNSYSDVEFSVSNSMCTNDNGVIQINQVNGNFTNYSIILNSNPVADDLVPGLASGAYTLSITDGFCSLDTNFSIGFIAGIEGVDLGLQHENCLVEGMITVDEINGGTSPYLTSLNNSVFSSTLIYDGLQASVYSLEVTDANNCMYDTLIVVEDNSTDISLMIDIQMNCELLTATAEFAASNGLNSDFTYELENQTSTTGLFTDLLPGIYSLTVLDDQGCSLDTTVSINSFNTIDSLVFSVQNAYCDNSNGTFSLTAVYGDFVNPVYYLQSESIQMGQTLAGLESGIYILQATDENGCTYDTIVNISSIQLEPFSLLYSSVIPGCDKKGSVSINEVSGGFSPYTFSYNGGAFSPNTSFQFIENGSLDLTILDEAGCSFDYSIPLLGATEFETLFIPNCFTPDGNEFNQNWFAHGNCIAEFECMIINRWGQILYEYKDINGYWDGTFNGEMCQDGVYFYTINVKYYSGKMDSHHGHITLIR